MKGSLLRRLVKSQMLQPHAEHVPAPLAAWFETPPLVSAWVPEVHMFAMLHLLRDLVYDDAKLDEFVGSGIQRMISSPLYKLMFLVVSPTRLLHGIGRRWEQFHRGTAMEVGRDTGSTIDAVVTHPATCTRRPSVGSRQPRSARRWSPLAATATASTWRPTTARRRRRCSARSARGEGSLVDSLERLDVGKVFRTTGCSLVGE